jgi:hypothetical protein
VPRSWERERAQIELWKRKFVFDFVALLRDESRGERKRRRRRLDKPKKSWKSRG